MSNVNEILAKQIIDKLKEEKLIHPNETELLNKLSKGTIKDTDWKSALEATINNENKTTKKENEAQ